MGSEVGGRRACEGKGYACEAWAEALGDGSGDFRSEMSVTEDPVLGEAPGLRLKKDVNLLPGV